MILKYMIIFIVLNIEFVFIFSFKSYNNYSVYRVLALNQKQFEFIEFWTRNVSNSESLFNSIDIWKYPTHVSQECDFMLSPNIKTKVLEMFRNENFLEPKLIIENVNTLILNEEKTQFLNERQNYSSNSDNKSILDQFWEQWNQIIPITTTTTTTTNTPITNINNNTTNSSNKVPININELKFQQFFKSFENIEKIYGFMDELVSLDSNNIRTETIGMSSEGRQLKIIRIGLSSSKPVVWIDGGTHAREWLGITTVLYITYQLSLAQNKCFVLNSNECSKQMKEMLLSYDFHILPVLNPDGYTYSRQHDRMWRKTRSKSHRWCVGVDPNRNYDIAFGGSGTSANPCSDQYPGERAFSEPETSSQRNHLLAVQSTRGVALFVSMHTYSQLLLYPWSHTTQPSPHAQALSRVATHAYNALRAVYGTEYRLGTASTILYSASGSGSDWAHSALGVKYSYTFELRDRGQYGFVAPPQAIVPCAAETMEAIKAMVKAIKD